MKSLQVVFLTIVVTVAAVSFSSCMGVVLPVYVPPSQVGIVHVEARRYYCPHCGWWVDLIPDMYGNYPPIPGHICRPTVLWVQVPGPSGIVCWNWIGPVYPGYYWDIRFQIWQRHRGHHGPHHAPPGPSHRGGGHRGGRR